MKDDVMRFRTAVAPLPLASTVFGASRDARLVALLAAVALLWISARIQIPLWPVPITMQTYVVIVIAMGCGTRLGLAAIGSYVALGALGLPVFAGTPEKGIGLAYLAGPTGGYVVGFIVAGIACGALAARGWDRTLARAFVAALLGHALIIGCGAAWLATTIGWSRAVAVGVAPFAWGTFFKCALVAITLAGGARLLGARR
jgi:biotin transport system substrate-specific component